LILALASLAVSLVQVCERGAVCLINKKGVL